MVTRSSGGTLAMLLTSLMMMMMCDRMQWVPRGSTSLASAQATSHPDGRPGAPLASSPPAKAGALADFRAGGLTHSTAQVRGNIQRFVHARQRMQQAPGHVGRRHRGRAARGMAAAQQQETASEHHLHVLRQRRQPRVARLAQTRDPYWDHPPRSLGHGMRIGGNEVGVLACVFVCVCVCVCVRACVRARSRMSVLLSVVCSRICVCHVHTRARAHTHTHTHTHTNRSGV